MISTENFYWVLHQNLLAPTDIDAWYHFPFGTTQNLSKMEFPNLAPTQSHVLFHYDQEPIWPDQFSVHYDGRSAWSSKVIRILANSEHSDLKSAVCRERDMLDWYFFYHGFASLDWFRDAQYIEMDAKIDKPFLILNHLVRDYRAYRMALLARLFDNKSVTRGLVSFHGSQQDCVDELHNVHGLLSDLDRSLISDHLVNCDTLPWTLDKTIPDSNFSAQFGHREFDLWQRTLFHVVTETVFYEPKKHLTEKIFKPIVCGRPFVLVAAPGNLAYLRGYGFKTFTPWIDESYDDINNHDQRLNMIAHEISRIADLSPEQLNKIKQDMVPILEHNKRHFFGEFRSIIANELVDNFDRCVRLWNNGRVDNRQKPLLTNLESVKRILSA